MHILLTLISIWICNKYLFFIWHWKLTLSLLRHFQLDFNRHSLFLSILIFSCGFAMGCIEGRVAVEFFSEMQNKVVQQKSKLTVLWSKNVESKRKFFGFSYFNHPFPSCLLSFSFRLINLLLSYHLSLLS